MNMNENDKKKVENVNPYCEGSAKGEQVEEMFDSIAPAYDFMNTAMTFGLHRHWRDKALCRCGQCAARQQEGVGRLPNGRR